MAASDLINLSGLIDAAKCFALVRQHRWPEGARCSRVARTREWAQLPPPRLCFRRYGRRSGVPAPACG